MAGVPVAGLVVGARQGPGMTPSIVLEPLDSEREAGKGSFWRLGSLESGQGSLAPRVATWRPRGHRDGAIDGTGDGPRTVLVLSWSRC